MKEQPLDNFIEKLETMKDTIKEAEFRGMKNINVWHDHILIELQSKVIRVFYDGRIEESTIEEVFGK